MTFCSATSSARLFGLRSIWRSTARLAVSDPSRTLIDILDSPANGGGIRHVAEIVDAYFRSEQHRKLGADPDQVDPPHQRGDPRVIGRAAIVERVSEWGLREDVVEKDYVLGWVL